MGKFVFQAKNRSGQTVSGSLEGNDENDVRQKLAKRHLQPVRVLSASGIAVGNKKGNQPGFFAARISSKELQIFTRQFSTLINAGIPIVEALGILSEGKRNQLLKDTVKKIKASIEAGKRLGESMAAHPTVFDRFYVNMVRAGEEAGILDGILARLAIYLEKSERLKKQIKGALTYPAVILVIAIAVVVGLLVFIIPRFQDLYTSSGKELPGITQMIVAMSNFCIERWYVLVGVIVGLPVLLVQWYRTEEGKNTIDRFLIGAPIFGELVQKAAVARMTRTLSTLLGSGVGVIDALDIASKTAGNTVIEEALARSKEAVTAGRNLASPLTKEKMIPDMVTQMIAIGEKSGTLDQMLGKIADFYEDDVENAVKAVTSLIEPLMMVVLGLIIAFLVVGMYLPIFDMASMQGGR